MATNKYSVRGEADMKQHDSAIKKSAAEVYKYKKQVEDSSKQVKKFGKQVEGAKGNVKKFGNDISGLLGKVTKLNPAVGSLVSAFSRFAPGIGLATGAFALLKETIESTQFSGDALTITLEKTKASVSLFTSALAMGNFDNFKENLKSIRKEAEEAAKALDNFTTKTLTNKAAYAKYNAERSKLERIIKDPKSTPEQIKNAQNELDELPKKMEAAFQQEANLAKDAFVRAFDVIAEEKGKETIKKRVEEIFKNSTPSTAWDNVAKFYENIILENEMLFDKLSEKEQKQMVDLYLEWQNLIRLSNELYSNNSRLLNESTSSKSTSSKSTSTKAQSYDEERIRDLDIAYWGNMAESGKYRQGVNWKYTPVIPPEELEEIEDDAVKIIQEAEQKKREELEKTNKELAKQREIFDLQLHSISSLGSALSTLGSEFNSTGLEAAGIIAQAIATLIEGYAKAMASFKATSSPWAWIGFSVAGLATLTSVISQIHSLSGYASGGIIQGANTIGDYNLARVNSGEMILNGTQQARLFRMLNNGSSASGSVSGSVEFKIKGQELVGVLNNYTKKTRRVL